MEVNIDFLKSLVKSYDAADNKEFFINSLNAESKIYLQIITMLRNAFPKELKRIGL
jgi:hypothetical protein